MDRKWREENERIMRDYPLLETPPDDQPMVELGPTAEAQAYLGLDRPDEPPLPLEPPPGDKQPKRELP
jgi:hypothetical protein